MTPKSIQADVVQTSRISCDWRSDGVDDEWETDDDSAIVRNRRGLVAVSLDRQSSRLYDHRGPKMFEMLVLESFVVVSGLMPA